jgi:hypothetical protein
LILTPPWIPPFSSYLLATLHTQVHPTSLSLQLWSEHAEIQLDIGQIGSFRSTFLNVAPPVSDGASIGPCAFDLVGRKHLTILQAPQAGMDIGNPE